jgi:hypothetical protein
LATFTQPSQGGGSVAEVVVWWWTSGTVLVNSLPCVATETVWQVRMNASRWPQVLNAKEIRQATHRDPEWDVVRESVSCR